MAAAPRQSRWRALWYVRVHNVGCFAGAASLAVRPQPPCGTDAKRRQQRKAEQEGNTTAKKQERKTRHRGFCCDVHTRNFCILFDCPSVLSAFAPLLLMCTTRHKRREPLTNTTQICANPAISVACCHMLSFLIIVNAIAIQSLGLS